MRVTTRRLAAVVRTTAVELLGEPFVFLMLLASLALTVAAPVFHYHQFGEVARMARDAGFSAFLLGGSVALVFAMIRSVRREIESGTCESALAHALSPAQFLFAKIVGGAVAGAVVLTSVFALTLVMVNGAEIGGRLAARSGGLVRPWGGAIAIGFAVLVLPVTIAAALNRFANRRFTLLANYLTLALSVAGACVCMRGATVVRYLPIFVLAAIPLFFLASVAGVLAFRFRTNVAAAGTGLVAAVLVPALGSYCLAEVLAEGGFLPLRFLFLAFLAALPAFGVLVVAGLSVTADGKGDS